MLNNTEEQDSCKLVVSINNLNFHCEIRRCTCSQLLFCNSESNMDVITNYIMRWKKVLCITNQL